MLTFLKCDSIISFSDRLTLAPRKVCIVLSPSGVIKIKHLAVGIPSFDGLHKNFTFAFSISFINSMPKSSSLTLPQKTASPPNSEIPTIEFATEPQKFF